MEKQLTCIRCPIGCQLSVRINGSVVTVTGNTCSRGKEYGIMEIKNPKRTVTSIVKVNGGILPVVSVKTKSDIPKDKIFLVMEEIHRAEVSAPVCIGDVIIQDVAHTGSDIIATKTVDSKREGKA
ncbi:MAG: DUF1667 domain-containing protein [Clostridia bacterium]|nr:DUF1667 domain-containing protein [Clostridia bacterium]